MKMKITQQAKMHKQIHSTRRMRQISSKTKNRMQYIEIPYLIKTLFFFFCIIFQPFPSVNIIKFWQLS